MTKSFNFLISWNVLHYEPTVEGIAARIAEYARALKPGDRLNLSTTGPDHKILEVQRLSAVIVIRLVVTMISAKARFSSISMRPIT